MTKSRALVCYSILIACVTASAVDQPGVIASGNLGSRDGWKLSYSTVVRPPMPGQHTSLQSGLLRTDSDARHPLVFHRFLGDAAARTYFGYDVVVEARGNSAKLRFRPLTIRPQDLPREYQATGSRIVSIREFPRKTFQTD